MVGLFVFGLLRLDRVPSLVGALLTLSGLLSVRGTQFRCPCGCRPLALGGVLTALGGALFVVGRHYFRSVVLVRAGDDSPAFLGWLAVDGFDESVVVRAEQYQVYKGGGSAGPPGHDVVCMALGRWGVAAGEDALGVPQNERGSDCGGDEPLAATDIQHLGRAAQHDREDVGIAGQPP